MWVGVCVSDLEKVGEGEVEGDLEVEGERLEVMEVEGDLV